jgi:hypothetical protein
MADPLSIVTALRAGVARIPDNRRHPAMGRSVVENIPTHRHDETVTTVAVGSAEHLVHRTAGGRLSSPDSRAAGGFAGRS